MREKKITKKNVPVMTTVYVGNLSYERKESAIKSLFLRYGDVKVVKLMKEGRENKSRGVAFVEMFVREEALSAIAALNGQVIDGRTLKVSEAIPQEEELRKAKGKR